MADPNEDPNKEEQGNEDELQLEEVVKVTPEELDDNQKIFLKDNKEDLSDEEKETYKEIIKDDEEEEKEINLDDIKPEIRRKKEEEEKDDDEDEEIDEDEEKVIKKVVSKELKSVKGLKGEIQAIKDETEVDAYIRVKPELEKYRGVALKYMSDPAYSNIPAHNIFAIVTNKDSLKLGDTKDKGTQARTPSKGATDWKNATKEEFQAKKSEVLGHQG